MRLLLLSACVLLACRTAAPAPSKPSAPPPAPAPIHLTLVATNDVHGWLEPHVTALPSGEKTEIGGMATFAGYVDILRRHNPGGVVLLDAGDLFQGTLISNLFEGRPVIEAYNRLGYLASALGNHEFDYGPEGPHAVPTRPDEDPFGALEALVQEAHFPFLAANVFDAATGEHPRWLGNDGTLLREVDGVKVGVVGLSTVTTPSTTNPTNVRTLRFAPLAPVALEAAHRLRQQGAEVVVLIAHAGAQCRPSNDEHDLSTCNPRDSEILELLQALPQGTFDAVIAGHTHQGIAKFVGPTPVIETSALGRSFGRIELYVDPVHRKVLRDRTRLEPQTEICAEVDPQTHRCDPGSVHHPLVPASFEGEPVHEDPSMAALIAPWQQRVEQIADRPTPVRLAAPLTRDYDAESPLGDVLSDALRRAAHADVALLNGGGLRADLPEGPLTYGKLYEVLPFDNTLAVVTVNGAQLRALLGAAYAHRGGLYQESGLKVRLGACPGPQRLREVLLANGRRIDPRRTYRVAMPDFLARGGAGLKDVMASLPPSQVDLGGAVSLRDALLAALSRTPGTLQVPPPGRIRIDPPAGPCPDAH